MNIVFIENILGSGQVITVQEDFGDNVFERDLKPGENTRIVVSRFKSLVIKERAVTQSSGAPDLFWAPKPRQRHEVG
jgi:hypothetical protein